MAIETCLSQFIIALSAPYRAQLRQLLYSMKTIVEAQITAITLQLDEYNIFSQAITTATDQIEKLLSPIENTLAIIPLDSLAGCTQGVELFSNLENTYYNYKYKYEDLAFKAQQYTSLSTYNAKFKEKLEIFSDQLEEAIDSIDAAAVSMLTPGQTVRNYKNSNSETILSMSGTQITTGSGTYDAGDIGVINT